MIPWPPRGLLSEGFQDVRNLEIFQEGSRAGTAHRSRTRLLFFTGIFPMSQVRSSGMFRLFRLISRGVTMAPYLLVIPWILSGLSMQSEAADLTFEQRVAAQRAIEQVYYAHQADASLPFDEAVPAELIERKVRDYLRQSAALAERWHEPITAAMLGEEAQRMAKSTRMPDRLTELYATLGNDPVLVLE